jgi:hypothetical protein
MTPLLTALAALVAANPAIPVTEAASVTDRVSVISHSGTVPYSGYLRTWIALRVLRSDGSTSDLYLPYLFENQFVPPEGSLCTARFHSEAGEGNTSERSLHDLAQIYAVDDISCATGRFVLPVYDREARRWDFGASMPHP